MMMRLVVRLSAAEGPLEISLQPRCDLVAALGARTRDDSADSPLDGGADLGASRRDPILAPPSLPPGYVLACIALIVLIASRRDTILAPPSLPPGYVLVCIALSALDCL
jgi:hypothetical protein